MIAEASKGELAEAVRILALNLAQYQAKFGELPAEEYLSLSSARDGEDVGGRDGGPNGRPWHSGRRR